MTDAEIYEERLQKKNIEYADQLKKDMENDIRNIKPIPNKFLTTIGEQDMPQEETNVNQEAINTIVQATPSIIESIFKHHWLTTVLGIVTIIPAVLDASGVHLGFWGSIVSAISAGAGLIFSKSVNVKD